MPLNEILGNQTETQLWAFEMTPKALGVMTSLSKQKEIRTALNKTTTKAQ